MSVITISRLRGSGGREMGHKVAERLGYHFVDKHIIEQIFLRYGFLNFSAAYDKHRGFWEHFDKRHKEIMDFLEKVTHAIAKYGDVVILGRGGFAVFPNYSDVLNVRLWAPLHIRAQRIMKQAGTENQEEVERILKLNDRERDSFIEDFIRKNPNRESYFKNPFDIVINTGKTTRSATEDLIVRTADQIKGTKKENMDFTGNLEVDLKLMDVVSNVVSIEN